MTFDHAITLTILHSLWQGAIISLAAAATLRLLRHAPANARYVVAVVALSATALAGVLTFTALRAPGSAGNVASWLAAGPLLDTSYGDALSTGGAPTSNEVSGTNGTEQMARDRSLPGLREGVSPAAAAGSATPPAGNVAPYVAALWIFGVGGFGLYFLCGWAMTSAIRSRAARVPAERIALRARDIGVRMGVDRSIRVYSCARASTPVVVGWLRPAILLPVSVVTGLPPRQLDLIIAHEIAHIRRHDYAVNLFQLVVETLYFFNPSVWWLSREIRIERERACDDLVVSGGGQARDYAAALARLAQMHVARHGTQPRFALGAADGSLADRIRRVLQVDASPGEQHGTRGAITGRLAAGLMLVALAVLTVSTAPVMAQLWSGILPTSTQPQVPAKQSPPAPSSELPTAILAPPPLPSPTPTLPTPPSFPFPSPSAPSTAESTPYFRSADHAQTAVKLEALIANPTDDATLGSALREFEKLPSSATLLSWIRLLETSDILLVRTRAITVLANLDPRFVVSALERATLHDQSSYVQMLALKRLDRLPDDRGVPALLSIARVHTDITRRIAALNMLSARGGEVAGLALERALYDDPSTQIQLEALRLLVWNAPNVWNTAVLQHVRDNHFNRTVRERAAALLNEARADAGVSGAVPDYAAASTLRRGQGLGSTAVKLEQLVFADESDATRLDALEAIAALSGGAGLISLKRIAATHPSRDIRTRAVTLANVAKERQSFRQAMAKAENTLRYDADATRRVEAIAELAQSDALAVVGTMHTAILEDASRDVQMRALSVLAARDELAAGDALAKVARSHPDSMIRGVAIGLLQERLNLQDALDVLATVLVDERDYGVWSRAAEWAADLPDGAGLPLLESVQTNADLPIVFRQSAASRLRDR